MRRRRDLGKKMVESQPTLWDLDARFRIMDRYDDYMQVIAMIGPPVESVAQGQAAVDLARIANDEAARLVAKHPTRFLCGLANLPLGDTEAALKELERAVLELKLKGIFLHTPLYFHSEETKPPAGGKPLDSPELIPIYEKMAEFNLPIWIHPNPLVRLQNTGLYQRKRVEILCVAHLRMALSGHDRPGEAGLQRHSGEISEPQVHQSSRRRHDPVFRKENDVALQHGGDACGRGPETKTHESPRGVFSDVLQ